MKRSLAISLVMFLMIGSNGIALAAEPTSNDLIITEVLVGSAANSRQEFIEIVNRSDRIIDFNDEVWSVQIAGSSAKDWSSLIRTIKLTGYVYPKTHYLIGSSYSQTIDDVSSVQHFPESADGYYAAALSATAGHIRIVKTETDGQTKTVHDQLEWGVSNAVSIDQKPIFYTAKPIVAGKSLERTLNSEKDYIVSDDNNQNFMLAEVPSPLTTTADQPELPMIPETELPDDTIEEAPETPQHSISITELLPNPADPFTDANDEFIELYNEGAEPINIKGMSLKTGSTTLRTYTFKEDTWLEPLAYRAFFSRDTKLALSNTTSRAQLVDSAGTVISESASYTTAQSGSAWQTMNDEWQWSASPTPGSANQFVLPLASATKTNVAKSTVAKALTPKTKAATKAKAAKKTKAAKAKTVKAKKTKVIKAAATAYVAEEPAKPAAIHAGILAAVLGIALLYGAYEYRHELARRFKQFGSNRVFRRSHRQES